MKIRGFFLVFVVTLLFSCGDFIIIEFPPPNGDVETPPAETEQRTFWAQNAQTNVYYQLQADLMYEGVHCDIWVEAANSARVSETAARSMANTFDSRIYPSLLSAFSTGQPITFSGKSFSNALELADYMADGDGKLTILLLDIRDGYTGGGYVAGYFSEGDMLSSYRYSNLADMIYIDINPGSPTSQTALDTLAHEAQHLMNYTTSMATRGGRKMDLWIDEGLAESTAWIWSGNHNQERVNWYIADQLQTIARGNNFFMWGNNNTPNAILDEYATVYLFFQWMRLQAGSSAVYRSIFNSQYTDHRAVTTAMHSADPNMGYNDWGTVLRTWMAANFINAASGPYGYLNDQLLKDVRHRYIVTGAAGQGVALAPGEAIFSNRTSMPERQEMYVSYAGMPAYRSTSAPATTPGDSGFTALLSYNVDTRQTGPQSLAYPFSVTSETTQSQVALSIISPDTARMAAPLQGPFAISMRDMLAINGFEDELNRAKTDE